MEHVRCPGKELEKSLVNSKNLRNFAAEILQKA